MLKKSKILKIVKLKLNNYKETILDVFVNECMNKIKNNIRFLYLN